MQAIESSGVFERYFTRSEERYLFALVRRQMGNLLSRRDYWIMVAMRHSGGRVGSIAGLNVGDADKALLGEELTFHTAKGGRTYSIHVNRVLRKALRELLKVRMAMGHRNDDPAEPLIMSRKHKRISVRSLQSRVGSWCKFANIKGTPHFFRHTLGRRIIETSEAREPSRIVQKVLGHTNPASTAIYTAPGREDVRAAMEAQA